MSQFKMLQVAEARTNIANNRNNDSTTTLAVHCKQVHLLASAAYESSVTAEVSRVLRPSQVPRLWISEDIASCMRAELPWQFPMKHRLANGKEQLCHKNLAPRENWHHSAESGRMQPIRDSRSNNTTVEDMHIK